MTALSLGWALGDVRGTVADSRLTVLGDASPNSIQITPGIGTGAFVVTGVEGTAINGGASFAAVDVRKIEIEMNEGRNRV